MNMLALAALAGTAVLAPNTLYNPGASWTCDGQTSKQWLLKSCLAYARGDRSYQTDRSFVIADALAKLDSGEWTWHNPA